MIEADDKFDTVANGHGEPIEEDDRIEAADPKPNGHSEEDTATDNPPDEGAPDEGGEGAGNGHGEPDQPTPAI